MRLLLNILSDKQFKKLLTMKILKFVFYKVAFSLSIVIILPLLLCIFVFLYKDTTTLLKMVFYVKTGFIVL